jgi:hypothetical protein
MQKNGECSSNAQVAGVVLECSIPQDNQLTFGNEITNYRFPIPEMVPFAMPKVIATDSNGFIVKRKILLWRMID